MPTPTTEKERQLGVGGVTGASALGFSGGGAPPNHDDREKSGSSTSQTNNQRATTSVITARSLRRPSHRVQCTVCHRRTAPHRRYAPRERNQRPAPHAKYPAYTVLHTYGTMRFSFVGFVVLARTAAALLVLFAAPSCESFSIETTNPTATNPSLSRTASSVEAARHRDRHRPLLARRSPGDAECGSPRRRPRRHHADAAVMQKLGASFAVGLALMFASLEPAALAVDQQQSYDGFAEYAKENKMQQSDVGCFVAKCGEQTKNLFSNPRGIKGVSCLGRCKGEQSCATRCFAEFGSENLNDWLSCTIEENECVKVPKNVDNSAENVGYPAALKQFDPSSLIGTWYKTDGTFSIT